LNLFNRSIAPLSITSGNLFITFVIAVASTPDAPSACCSSSELPSKSKENLSIKTSLICSGAPPSDDSNLSIRIFSRCLGILQRFLSR
jgi:hypothetical protein